MNISDAIKITNQIAKGKQFSIVYSKTITPKKKSDLYGKKIKKISKLNVRLVTYGNQAAVKEKRDNGMEKCPNNWTKLSDGIFQDHNGIFKMCLAPTKLKNQVNSSKYLLENKEIEYAELENHLLSKDKKKTNLDIDWFTLSIDNILEIKA